MIYLSTDCHILPLTGLNAFVYTGLNVQKLLVDGMGRMVISVSTSSKSFKKMGAEVNTLANPYIYQFLKGLTHSAVTEVILRHPGRVKPANIAIPEGFNPCLQITFMKDDILKHNKNMCFEFNCCQKRYISNNFLCCLPSELFAKKGIFAFFCCCYISIGLVVF